MRRGFYSDAKGGKFCINGVTGPNEYMTSETMLLADGGYDADWIRVLAAKKGAWANIPPRCNRKEPICFSPYLYRARNLVERFFNKIKHCRRVATRYDKLAANYLAFVQLAGVRREKAALSSGCEPHHSLASLKCFPAGRSSGNPY